ncbi:MAG: hypothetical protein ABR508_06970 [Candidatus Baltobacteraceae bacterium]
MNDRGIRPEELAAVAAAVSAVLASRQTPQNAPEMPAWRQAARAQAVSDE